MFLVAALGFLCAAGCGSAPVTLPSDCAASDSATSDSAASVVPWDGMTCADAPNKEGVDPACTGATITGVATCGGCTFPAGAVITLYQVTYPHGEWHGGPCAEAALAADGSFTFASVAPGDGYQVRYEGAVLDADGVACTSDSNGTTVVPLCSADLVAHPRVLPSMCGEDR
jgi:hypothetical protein